MRRMKIINAAEVRRTPFTEAANAFYKHCRVRNLRPHHHLLQRGFDFFHGKSGVKYVDEITQEVFDEFFSTNWKRARKQVL